MWVWVADIGQLKIGKERGKEGRINVFAVTWKAESQRFSFKVDKSKNANLSILNYIKINTKKDNTE